MSFIMEVKQNRTGEEYAEAKGYEGSVRCLEIPESYTAEPGSEYKVSVIGNHAFSSRKDVEEVVIPESVHTILGFAFHNCGKLRKISLTDSVKEYLDGGTRQCESLREIEVTMKNGNPYIIRRILEDNDRRLTFNLHMSDGDALLVFPGFNYDFVENTMARTIQFAIEGTGYAYRECVKADQINFREYDSLFSKESADDSVTAEMIAIARLSVPYELSDDAKDSYENWLRDNALHNLTRAVKEPEKFILDKYELREEHLAFYTERKLIKNNDAKELAHLAADMGIATIVSMLMDYQNSDKGVQNNGDTNIINDGEMLELDF